MAEPDKKHQKLKDIVERSQYWDVEDLLRNLDQEIQRMEQGLSHVIWDMENRPVTQCPFPLPATPRFETEDSQTEFKVKVKLPGVPKENIDVRVDRQSVEIYARQDDKVCRPFYIRVDSPSSLSPAGAGTKLEGGELTVSVKKVRKTKIKVN